MVSIMCCITIRATQHRHAAASDQFPLGFWLDLGDGWRFASALLGSRRQFVCYDELLVAYVANGSNPAIGSAGGWPNLAIFCRRTASSRVTSIHRKRSTQSCGRDAVFQSDHRRWSEAARRPQDCAYLHAEREERSVLQVISGLPAAPGRRRLPPLPAERAVSRRSREVVVAGIDECVFDRLEQLPNARQRGPSPIA
jgi:hypothetical protein